MRVCDRAALRPVAVLAAAYAVALGVALANPANARPHVVDVSAQALGLSASVALLLLVRAANAGVPGCAARTRVSWAATALLAASLAVRLPFFAFPNQAALGRWDSLMAVYAFVLVCTEAYFALVPPGWQWRLQYAGLLFVGLPLLTALPNVLRTLASRARADVGLLRAAAAASLQAYRLDGSTIYDPATDTHVVIVPTGTAAPGGGGAHAFIAFAGTNSLKDVRTDLTVADAPLPAGFFRDPPRHAPRVHAGFLRAYLSVRERVQAVAAERAAAGQRVVFCGHSLGGALATLAALDFAGGRAHEAACVTFGSPQVGDALLAAAFDAAVPDSTRVVNPYDWVPRALSTQFEHVKGYYFVTTPRPAQDVYGSHSMAQYAQALGRSRAATWALLFAPAAYSACFVLLIVALKRGWRHLRKK